MGIPLFLLRLGDPPQARRSLRRLALISECPNGGSHRASTPIGTYPLILSHEGYIAPIEASEYDGDPHWPTHCTCGYEFTSDDRFDVEQDPIYVTEDGREFSLKEAPPGAMWEATWMGEWARVNGGAGPAWVIRLPNGHDFLPGQGANNCDRNGGDHDCWCVHGEAPNLTIDKHPEPGRSTCTAGAGSILSCAGSPQEWHGFVTNGELVG